MTEATPENSRSTLVNIPADSAEPADSVSGSVNVADIIDEYADLSDTMIARKTVSLDGAAAGRTQMQAAGTGAPSETIQMNAAETGAPSETIQMNAAETGAPSETIQMNAAETGAPSETIQMNAAETGAPSETIQMQASGAPAETIAMNATQALAASEAEKKSADGEKSDEAEQAEEPQPADPETEAIKQKIRERKKEKIRKAKQRRIRFWTILISIVAAIGAFIFSISGFFTVDSIEVRGNKHFTAEEIINIAHAVPGHNLIYDPGKQEIIDYLQQNPYIKTADVTRKLPSTLVITVNERVQACAFRYDDDYLIMDSEGILLKKTRTEPKITMIKGMVVTKLKLGEKVGTENQKLFSSVLRIIRSMNAADMYFVTLDMTSYEDDYQVRAYIYDNLVVRSDLSNLIENLDNGRLHKVADKLFDDEVSRGTIIIGEDGTISFEPGI